MKFLPKVLLIHAFAKYCSRFKTANRVDIMIRTIRLAIRNDSPREKLNFLLEMDRNLYGLEQNAAVEYGKGIHPKHRLINYKQFFTENLNPKENILDIGCGNGFLSYEVVSKVPEVKVLGIELDKRNIEYAQKHFVHPNLTFVQGDAIKELPDKKFNVIILSNVLEHIENRVDFLKDIVFKLNPSRLLIRVPLFEREWRTALKKELGVDYRLDDTHFIEYTTESYLSELHLARLKPTKIEYRWGEIWSVVTPLSE